MTSPAEMLASVTGFIRRQLPVIAVIVLISIVLGMVYYFTTPPMYTAQASLIIDTHNDLHLFQKQQVVADNTVDTGMVESEVRLLESENVSQAVIKKLHLADDREFIDRGGGLLGALADAILELFGSQPPQNEFDRTRRAVEVFANRLSVKRAGLSYVINISFRSLDPQRAADIANAVANAYIDDQLEAKFQAARRAGDWLQERLKELREESMAADRAVVEFQAQHNIVSTGGADKRLVDQQQVAELNSQLVIARAKVSETQAALKRIEAILSSDSPDFANLTVSDTLKDDVITKLRSQYLELATRESDWSKRYGAQHLAVVNLRNQMNELQNAILTELRRIAQSYKSDYEIAKQGEEGIQKQLAQAVGQSQVTDRAQVELSELESNAKSYHLLYDDFLQRYIESVQQASFPITEARVVTPATRPLKKSSPKLSLTLLISTAGGLIFGLGLARVRDLSDRVFRTRTQVEEVLGLDCLATLPKLDRPNGPPREAAINRVARRPNRLDQVEECQLPLALGIVDDPCNSRTITRQNDILWHVVDFPLSPYTEAIRSIRMAASVGGMTKSNKIIGITSSLPDEGKSTTAASLAQLIAHSGRRVILIDCDLRASKLTRHLSPDAKAGLLDVASGNASMDQAIWTDPSTNLHFLPTFETHNLFHTADLIEADEMKALFEKLRQSYDYIVVDLPPLVPNVDVRATKGLVDCYVFVIEWGRTKIDLVERALKEAGIVDNILGIVLNKVRATGLKRYEGYGHYEHSKYYYSTPLQSASWAGSLKSFARKFPEKMPSEQTIERSRRAVQSLRRYLGGRG